MLYTRDREKQEEKEGSQSSTSAPSGEEGQTSRTSPGKDKDSGEDSINPMAGVEDKAKACFQVHKHYIA